MEQSVGAGAVAVASNKKQVTSYQQPVSLFLNYFSYFGIIFTLQPHEINSRWEGAYVDVCVVFM